MATAGSVAFPPIGNPRKLVSRKSKRRKFRDRTQPEEELFEKTTVLVREDVFLMDNKVRRVQTNLLANSLTARLKKNLPEGVIENEAINKIRRDSFKDFQHLDNLERQYTSELHRESNRLDKETYQLLKRHKQLQKQSEMSRRKQDKLEASLRSRSGMSSVTLFPIAGESGGGESVVHRDTFPEFASVDKDDMSHVKVFKIKGVYMPTNKYSSRIEPLELSPRDKAALVKENTNIQDSLRMADNGTPVDLPSKSRMSKKGLRVSWSRQSRFYPEESLANESLLDEMSRTVTQMSFADSRTTALTPDQTVKPMTKRPDGFSNRVFNSRLSVRSDTFLIQNSKHFKGRRKIDTIGLTWKIPPAMQHSPIPECPSPHRHARMSISGVSHNLMPVTTAMQQQGRSTKKVCWQVQKPPPLKSLQMYQSWIEKLEQLKRHDRHYESGLPGIPNRANLSVMTQQV
ncbi:uncharacterized protein LOC127873762 [Dreissena polymorpha]|uniref:Uncharacterized protein n=1 Tax=Dreissena polymorpha TaxID=45954 RepID=A0A9D4QZN6_DREPO|nr:uncharacterized protein LOC127873762 [Dreissena polymorpha]XP_052273688.1 uncharacterized protein LOC127873762 [Dreissena polymorpha]KAH3847965.1 hypothetical protein DPMN_090301 [Dreissena polymorpha]